MSNLNNYEFAESQQNFAASDKKKEHIDLLLINPPFHLRNGGGNFFPLGLGYIISSVEAHGYTWRVINCANMITSFYSDDLDKLTQLLLLELKHYVPLLIGIGPCVTSQLRALDIISNCCHEIFPMIPIIAGGTLASIEGQEWLFFEKFGFNGIIKGDGELAILDAIRVIKSSGDVTTSEKISTSTYSFYNNIPDINTILFPYREINSNRMDNYSLRRSINATGKITAALITSRGCRYSCRYCVSGNIKPKSIRKRNIENIFAEIYHLHSTRGVNDIIFYDDCFFYNPQTICADISIFCNSIIERNLNITWQIELRPDALATLNIEAIILLEKSGCRQINLGIEKVADEGLNFLGKAIPSKGLLEQTSLIKNTSNIKLSATFILGGGQETRGDILYLISESKKFNLDFAHFNPLFIYPGTPLYDIVFNDMRAWVNYILEDSFPWGEIVYENGKLKRDDLLDLVDFAYTTFYQDTKFADQQMINDRFNIKRGVL